MKKLKKIKEDYYISVKKRILREKKEAIKKKNNLEQDNN